MSRIGKQPVTLPQGTTISQEGSLLKVNGSKGQLELNIPEGITLEQAKQSIVITRSDDSVRAAHGLFRALLQNAVTGVSNGWSRTLELVGVGMRANMQGSTLVMNLGFSHPVNFEIPSDVQVNVVKNSVTLSGIDKQKVGEIAAQIRKIKPPEPYKGKGIRFSDEKIRRKAGKTGKVGK